MLGATTVAPRTTTTTATTLCIAVHRLRLAVVTIGASFVVLLASVALTPLTFLALQLCFALEFDLTRVAMQDHRMLAIADVSVARIRLVIRLFRSCTLASFLLLGTIRIATTFAAALRTTCLHDVVTLFTTFVTAITSRFATRFDCDFLAGRRLLYQRCGGWWPLR